MHTHIHTGQNTTKLNSLLITERNTKPTSGTLKTKKSFGRLRQATARHLEVPHSDAPHYVVKVGTAQLR